MRRYFAVPGALIAILVVFILCGRVTAEEKLTQVSENVYAYLDKEGTKDDSFGANAGIIVCQDGIVVVDTLMSAKAAKRFIKDIKAVSDKPVKYVINTHYHLDHVFGNSEFVHTGAVIIAHEHDKKAMEKSAEDTLRNIGNYGLTPEDMQGTVPVYPSLTYRERMEIDMGDRKIILLHARHSHTDGDTLVYLPDSKVLFAGDLLFTDYHPFLGEGNIEEWAGALDTIMAMDIEKIIPGHGPLSGKKDLKDMKEYILAFDQKAKELVSRSNDLKEIVSEIQEELPRRSRGAWLIGPNIQMKYLKQE